MRRFDDADGPVPPIGPGDAGSADGAVIATEELLRSYRSQPLTALRDQLVERHLGAVESMARRLAQRLPRSVDPQDLVHAGMWGLMQAIDKYEPERCDQFLAFMRFRVRGAMLDELRTMDWLPKLWRRRQRDREDAVQRLRAALQREPDQHELAQELGVSVDVLQRSYGQRAWQQRAELQAPGGAAAVPGDDGEHDAMDSLADEALESPLESLSRQELLAVIEASLEPLEWQVLQLHYLEGLSGREVAARLSLSASRICQIHGQVLDRLKSRLAAKNG